MGLVFSLLVFGLRAMETFVVFRSHPLKISTWDILIPAIIEDLHWILYFLGLLFIFHVILSLISISIARWFSLTGMILAVLIQASLILYFQKTLLPLGKDMFAYSMSDIRLILMTSGVLNFFTIAGAILLIAGLVFLFNKVRKKASFHLKTGLALSISTYWFLLVLYFLPNAEYDSANETKFNIELNKSKYLTEQTFDYLMYPSEYYFDFYLQPSGKGLFVQKEFTDPNYPFLHKAAYPDVLSPFFDSLDTAPDLVFILVESLGKAYSGKDANLGSFTPFLDSLEQHSLVWTNAISSTGRTFGLLPGVFAGLPFGERGFLELYENYPHHESLISILNQNGYESSFFIGSDLKFDHEDSFLEYSNLDFTIDSKNFGSTYEKMPANNGFSWGYGDKEIFSIGLDYFSELSEAPQLRIFQTITSHDPYLVPERESYLRKFDEHIKSYLQLSDQEITEYTQYRDIYMTVMYADDAIKDFITSYSQLPEFNNTIFIITGDHRLPEIPMASRLDRFHVPLMIYSPLIQRPTYFKGLSSHFEITPSLLSFLDAQVEIDLPEQNTWMGQVLDTAQVFQSNLVMPLMRNKNQLVDFLDGNYFLSDDQLFVITEGLNIDPVDDQLVKNKLVGEFEDFKNKNNYTIQTRKLLPPQF
ncbi:LTA synthase family protein [Algoriphagus halophytocola]|uniref:LTA synthase family protein n=1 Tax=Algoriphagus halophytocola TaxID=2991499 RepID=A0ABY6MIV4_9BACT|nr:MULTISPECIES: LTA synthase family protein [unclassified Algoriphagus]UZD23720.1 LTA synthase family protein [Algoriphagus sp. TR-M5]WBL45014.1 LTA synthase family protein [Algoriphagus sp. TR-M9]